MEEKCLRIFALSIFTVGIVFMWSVTLFSGWIETFPEEALSCTH